MALFLFKSPSSRGHLATKHLFLLMCIHIFVPIVLSETLDGNETELSSTVASIALPRETTVIPTETLPLEKSTNGSTGQTTPPRIYLQKGNLKDGYLASKKDNDSYKAVHSNSSNGIQTSIQIYIIFFIGIVPAALGAALWWLQQNIRNICSGSSGKSKNNQADIEKLSHSLMKGDPNKVSIDNLAQQIARRAEKISNGENGALYNSYRSKLIKSRRVYSLEVPRKCLEMIEILGVGNFGEVWKAKTYQVAGKGSPMTVAVKTSKVNANMEQQEELLKELDIMLQLGSHPNVVRLLGCCTENEPYFLVLEYLATGKLLSYLRHNRKDGAYYLEPDGNLQHLSSLINNNNNYMTYCTNNAYGYSEINQKASSLKTNLSPHDLLQFAYDACKGMEFIASHGIVHRDLAARNILIDEKFSAKIGDFGMSRSIRDKESDMYEMKHSGQLPIRWMSPEALSMGLFSAKSDVWAFGVVLWEISTLGSTPYVGMSASEVISFIRQGNICPQPEHCSDQLYELMKSCWAYKSEDRFTFTDIKHHIAKMLLDRKHDTRNYIDLEHFNDSLYYFNTSGSPDEKL